jgi:hypothetical protein
MTAITVTGGLRQALYDKGWAGATLTIKPATPFDDAGDIYPAESAIIAADGGGLVSFIAIAPATGSASYVATLLDGSSFTTAVDDDDVTLSLSELLASGAPEASDTVTLTGEVLHPIGGRPWVGGEVKVTLNEAFISTAAVYPKGEWSIYLDADGKINGATGVTIGCKLTTSVSFTITLPDGTEYDASVNGTTYSTLDLSALV